MKNILGFIAFLALTLSGAFAQIEVLHIGDSLTCGDFGASLRQFYVGQLGTDKNVVIGSCGASPESYLKSHKTYYTHCGYRAHTPEGSLIRDWSNGKPKVTATPKLEILFNKYHPKILIVQLGTNWMDSFAPQSETKIIKEVVDLAKSNNCKIIWITPPDSSHYSRKVQDGVKSVIVNASKTYQFEIIDSSSLTHYTKSSGGDGIHYNTREARTWASKIIPILKGKLK